jgi:hypothetical protein
MTKRIIIAITVLMLISTIFFVGTSSAQTTTVKINPSTQTTNLQIGDTIAVNVSIANAANLWAWVASLYWDPTILQLQSNPTEGQFLKSDSVSTLFTCSVTNSTPLGSIPEVQSTRLSSSGISGSGDLTIVTFKVVGYGTTNIGLNTTLLAPELDEAASQGHVVLAHTDVNGTITIPQSTNPTPTPTSTPSSTAEPSSTPSTTPTHTTSPTNSPSASPTNNPANSNGFSFEIIAIIVGGIVLVAVLFSALLIQRKRK